MAKRTTNKDENLKFEQTIGKRASDKGLLDSNPDIELTDISRPAPQRRPKPNQSPVSRKNVVKKKTKNSSKKGSKRSRLLTFFDFSFIMKTVKQRKGKTKMSNKNKASDNNVEVAKVPLLQRFRGIIGIGLALVVVSIAYSVVVILLGTDGLLPKIMLAPQAIFAVIILGVAFAKILK